MSIQKHIKKRLNLKWFTELAIEAVVTTMIGGIIGTIWAYLKGLTDLLIFATGFLSACVVMVGLSIFFNYLKSRLVLPKKGFIDHWENRDKAIEEYNTIRLAILNETTNFNNLLTQDSKKLQPAIATGDSVKIRKVTSDMAENHNKYSNNMEVYVAKLEEITNLLIESSKGYYTRVTPKTEHSKQVLSDDRQAFYNLLKATQPHVLYLEMTRNSQIQLKNLNVSQKLTTALNRTIHVQNSIITLEKKAERHWGKLVKILDKKLYEYSKEQ